MPLERCTVEDRPGWRWGQQGRCYVFDSGDEESEKAARRKALNQGIAMGDIKVRSDVQTWERRSWMGEPVELRAAGSARMAVGYAIVWNQLSNDLGGFKERAVRGMAARTLLEQDIRSLFNHHPDNLLGRMGAGTLRAQEDTHGLRYEVDLPNTTLGRDLAELIGRGDVPGSSFGFMVVGSKGATWTRTDGGFPIRELRAVKIRDLGPVTFPAYQATDVTLRSLRDFLEEGATIPAEGGSQGQGEAHPAVRRRYF